MDDELLADLRLARVVANSDPAKSRELSLVITKIDEAIQWRQTDLQVKSSAENRKKEV